MSKRTQSIRSMFSAPDEPLSADNKALAPRVTSGAVKSLKDTFSHVERGYNDLREQLATGSVAIEIDPLLIDPSPYADRFDDQDAASYEALKASIKEHGQEIPILVREHPSDSARYQSAYGHRRVKVARELAIKVKAYVRDLSEEDLVVAQGIENSAREDLSFIERAVFACKLEDAGFQRVIVQSALSIDRAEASKLISVARAIPEDLRVAIGRAPKVGRGRWQAFAEAVGDSKSLSRMRSVARSERFKAADTNQRVFLLLDAGKPAGERTTSTEPQVVRGGDGIAIARVSRTAKQSRIVLDRGEGGDFADFLVSKLPDLYRTYRNEKENDN